MVADIAQASVLGQSSSDHCSQDGKCRMQLLRHGLAVAREDSVSPAGCFTRILTAKAALIWGFR